MQRILVSVFLVLLPFLVCSQGQTRTRKKTDRVLFANGNVKSVTVTCTTLPKYIDPMNFYKKVKVHVTEYDSVSKVKTREFTRITKIGKDGKPCYELYYEEIKYDAFGKRVSYEESKCDKRRHLFKEYREGELVYIRVQKRRKRR